MKKKIKRICKRIIALFCLSAVLVSSCAVGVIRQEPKEVKAIAGVDDIIYYAAQYMLWTIISACSAGGSSNNEILTPAESAGITNVPSAENYVHSTFSGNLNFSHIFKYSQAMVEVEAAIAQIYITSGYVVSKTYMDKLWSSFSEEDYRDLIGIDDDTYNPNIDDWDPEAWSGLTEEQKVSFLSEVLDDIEWNSALGKYVQVGPNPDYDNGGSNNENDDNNNHLNLPPYINTTAISKSVTSATFMAVYRLAKEMNRNKLQGTLLKDPKAPFDPSVCDYSVQYWKGHNNVLSLYDSDFALQYNTNLYLNIYTEFITSEFTDDKKIYPLLYYDENVPKFCLSSDVKSSNQNLLGLGTDSSFTMGSRYWDTGFPLSIPVKFFYGSTISQALIDQLNFDITNRGIMDSNKAIVKAPNLIDCGTYENVEKFRDVIKSGKYSLDDLLKLMADGWKGEKGASWTSIDDDGKTLKKKLDDDDGKYTTKVKVKDADGNETESKVVTYDSLVKGMTENVKTKPTVSTGVDGLFGDITYPDNGGATFPSWQGTNKNEGISGTLPDSGFDNNGDSSNDDNPTGGDTNTDNSDEEKEPDDIDPEKTKTPELLKKFPFCVPWDLVNLIQNLSAEKKAPKFKIPFVLKNKVIDIDKNIVIDFSKWEYLAEICRWFFRIIFILALVLLTRNIIKG